MRKLTLVTLIAMLTMCSGCFRVLVPVQSPWPVLPVPTPPHVDIPENPDTSNEDVKAFIKSTYQYQRHIEVLENEIKKYNEDAEDHNESIERKLYD